ncbi:PIN domain-containing protein [Streptomyces sp. NBC_01318]|uniref:PIN-like domain-containing protein n=1 Tax=Streptomyces sp. NBC_01318 TaxID=2903823 RepID=UPI002E11AF8A|nr:PIN domain-containing protein [Streptomyces sp. NBC_01318]
MVVLDTNVLLNLYRSNARTRQDTLAVLTKLRDRLWVPHQVLTEFWRNREQKSVRHHHSTKAKETSAALERVRRSASDAVERWVKDVRLKQDEGVTQRINESLTALTRTVEELQGIIDDQAERDALAGTAETHSDPVLTELEPLLLGRIGEPLPTDEYDKAVQTAQKRADEEIPPGYEDFRNKPPERAAGDYLLWLQLLQEAQRRTCDVLLVTGDVKKDWWQPRDGDIPARPRAELAVELGEAAGARLYMLTPAELLTWAEQLLDGLHVDKDSLDDLEQLRGADREDDAPEAGWNKQSLDAFIEQLRVRYPAHGRVIIAAAANGGFVDRATVYNLAGYAEDRQLKGFTRPVSTVARELEDQGVLSGEESFLLHTIYGSATEPSWASGFRIPDEVIPMLRESFEGGPLWPPVLWDGGEPDEGSKPSERDEQ